MKCPACEAQVSDEEDYCHNCGTKLSDRKESSTPATKENSASSMTELDTLVLKHKPFSMGMTFEVEDMSGNTLGGTEVIKTIPLKEALVDNNRQTVLTLEAVRARGLMYNHNIVDANGTVLGVMKMKNSFMGAKYEVTAEGLPPMLLTKDLRGYHFVLSAKNQQVIATGVLQTAISGMRTEITITPGTELDHRVIIGSMLYVVRTSQRGMSGGAIGGGP